MRMLLLETAAETGVVIAAQGQEVLASVFLEGGPPLSRNLAQEVDRLLQRLSFRPDLVVVGQGPGSFTGIRVGAALGQALAYGWQVPLVGISSLVGFAPPVDGPFAIIADARSGGFYVQKGVRKAADLSFEPPFLLPTSQASLALSAIPHFVSPHVERIQKSLVACLSPSKWFETRLDPTLLIQVARRQFSQSGAPPLEFTYCAHPGIAL